MVRRSEEQSFSPEMCCTGAFWLRKRVGGRIVLGKPRVGSFGISIDTRKFLRTDSFTLQASILRSLRRLTTNQGFRFKVQPVNGSLVPCEILSNNPVPNL